MSAARAAEATHTHTHTHTNALSLSLTHTHTHNHTERRRHALRVCVEDGDYRGTSLIRNCPPPQDNRRALGIVLL